MLIVVRITFIYFNQMFEFNKDGIELSQNFIASVTLTRQLGFYDKFLFEISLLVSG